jgi:hypothetical protein
MKLELFAAAIIATALITPAFAQDKPVTETPKTVAPKAQKNTPTKRHSHMEDRQGLKPSDQPVSESKPVDKSKHYHPRDR